MAEAKCQEYARLSDEAHSILKKLNDISAAQLQAFEKGDDAEFRRLDHELERMVGVKERTIGALRQHASDHGCRPPFLIDK